METEQSKGMIHSVSGQPFAYLRLPSTDLEQIAQEIRSGAAAITFTHTSRTGETVKIVIPTHNIAGIEYPSAR